MGDNKICLKKKTESGSIHPQTYPPLCFVRTWSTSGFWRNPCICCLGLAAITFSSNQHESTIVFLPFEMLFRGTYYTLYIYSRQSDNRWLTLEAKNVAVPRASGTEMGDACLSSSETHVMWLKPWENGGLMAFKWDLNGTVVGYNQLLTIIGINVGKPMP